MAKIAIDAGHGLYTAGKRCLAALDSAQTREWVLNNRIANELGRLLTNAGHQIKRIDDTDGSSDISLANRVKAANAWGADFYISVHHDAVGNGKVFTGGGTTVYVSNGCSAKSKQAQASIYKHAMNRAKLPGDNRSNGKRSANFYVIRYTKMPACLIECGFMDSAKDVPYILTAEWANKMALGIAEGICEVFGGSVNASAPSTPVKEQATAKPATKPAAKPATKPASNKPAELDDDGSWGEKTTRAAQYVLKTTQDGKISNQPAVNKKYVITAYGNTWEWENEYRDYKAGSNLIRAIQALTGVPSKERDGLFGKESIKWMQKFLKAKGYYTGITSGKLNKATTQGFQRYLNKQMGYK